MTFKFLTTFPLHSGDKYSTEIVRSGFHRNQFWLAFIETALCQIVLYMFTDEVYYKHHHILQFGTAVKNHLYYWRRIGTFFSCFIFRTLEVHSHLLGIIIREFLLSSRILIFINTTKSLRRICGLATIEIHTLGMKKGDGRR